MKIKWKDRKKGLGMGSMWGGNSTDLHALQVYQLKIQHHGQNVGLLALALGLNEHMKHLKTLLKCRSTGCNSVNLGESQDNCISKKHLSNAEAPGPLTILCEADPDFCSISEMKFPIVPYSHYWVSVLLSCSKSLARKFPQNSNPSRTEVLDTC